MKTIEYFFKASEDSYNATMSQRAADGWFAIYSDLAFIEEDGARYAYGLITFEKAA